MLKRTYIIMIIYNVISLRITKDDIYIYIEAAGALLKGLNGGLPPLIPFYLSLRKERQFVKG